MCTYGVQLRGFLGFCGIGVELICGSTGRPCFVDDGFLCSFCGDGGIWVLGLFDNGLLLYLGYLTGLHGCAGNWVGEEEMEGRGSRSKARVIRLI